jgi:hypothetical protein
MNKLRRDIRLAMLGAAAGLFSVSVFLMAARIDAYYFYLDEITYGPYERGVENLWWLPVSFWHVLLSIVASLVAHRYLTINDWSPFVLWQAIGALVLLGWALSFSAVVALEWVASGNLSSVRLLSTIDAAYVFKFAASVFACHVLYGSALEASSREYQQHNLDNPCESPALLKTHRSFQKVAKQSSVLVDESRKNDGVLRLDFK